MKQVWRFMPAKAQIRVSVEYGLQFVGLVNAYVPRSRVHTQNHQPLACEDVDCGSSVKLNRSPDAPSWVLAFLKHDFSA
jgi:hypothetical protein